MYDLIRNLKIEIEENLSKADHDIPLRSDGDIVLAPETSLRSNTTARPATART